MTALARMTITELYGPYQAVLTLTQEHLLIEVSEGLVAELDEEDRGAMADAPYTLDRVGITVREDGYVTLDLGQHSIPIHPAHFDQQEVALFIERLRSLKGAPG